MRRADSSKLHLPALGNTPKTTPSNPELYFPEFEVVDASSISIIEIKAGLQSSLAHNGFSAVQWKRRRLAERLASRLGTFPMPHHRIAQAC